LLDKDLKIKANLFQKLRDNNIFNSKQIINITYEQGKRLKLTREEDKMLTELCYYLSDKRNSELEFIIKKNDKEEKEDARPIQ
jgi:hypothetical protein